MIVIIVQVWGRYMISTTWTLGVSSLSVNPQCLVETQAGVHESGIKFPTHAQGLYMRMSGSMACGIGVGFEGSGFRG